MTVEEILQQSISGIKDEWNCLEKIRYVYIQLGKLLVKDTDFFFSAEGKLGEANLSTEDMSDIYENLNGREGKVICRSACYLLQKALEMVGINSILMKSNNNVTRVNDTFDVNHWFLCVDNYDNDERYFMTLSTDIAYIKNGLKTKHFGTHIPYIKDLSDGSHVRVYDGEEVFHTVISDDVLYKIDQKIGYINNIYIENVNNKEESRPDYEDAALDMVGNVFKDNIYYYDLLTFESNAYKELMDFKSISGTDVNFEDIKLTDIEKEDWDKWIKVLCTNISKKINEIINFNIINTELDDNFDYEEWLKEVVFRTQEFILLQVNNGFKSPEFKNLYYKDDMKYTKWSREVKKKFNYNEQYDYESIISLLDKTNALVKTIKNDFKGGKFSELFRSLLFHFLPSECLLENNYNEDGYLNNGYVARKLNVCFSSVFGCGKEKSEFNNLKYSEQILIIKKLIDEMFPEINQNNSIQLEGYNDRYSPILNRIQLYPIRNKATGLYDIVINIVGDSNNNDYYFFYDPRNNVFKPINILGLLKDYIIVSDRFKNKMDDLEDLDDNSFGSIK